MVVVENRTGAVLAVVGGRDANESRFNRATDAKRQLGSIFKPFVYLAAFDQGLRPDSLISDGPIEPGEIKGGGSWRPNNSDGKFGGMEPVSYGLIRSRNTMSVRVGNHAGIPTVKDVAARAGFTTPMPETPASFLGSWEATPWEIATAYTIFPNDGVRYRPYLISEIKDHAGNILYSTLPLSYQAASSGSAWSVSRILNEVTTRGTAASVQRLGFDKPCGGKTGTTNDFKDAWFAGYTSTLTCAVWVGFDIPEKNHPRRLWRHPRPAGLGRHHENRRPPRLQGRHPPQQGQPGQHGALPPLAENAPPPAARPRAPPAPIRSPPTSPCPTTTSARSIPRAPRPSRSPPPRRRWPPAMRPCAPCPWRTPRRHAGPCPWRNPRPTPNPSMSPEQVIRYMLEVVCWNPPPDA